MYDGLRKNPDEYQDVCDFLEKKIYEAKTKLEKRQAFIDNKKYFDDIENLNDIIDNRKSNLIMIACQYDNFFFVKYFYDRGVYLNHLDHNGQNAFFYINYSLDTEDEDEIFGFLLNNKIYILKKNNDKVNLLMVVTESSNIQYLIVLLLHGIDINDIDDFDKNALFYIDFTSKKAPDVLEFLLDSGINLFQQSNTGENILGYIEDLYPHFKVDEKKILENCIQILANWYVNSYCYNKFFDDKDYVKNTLSIVNIDKEFLEKTIKFIEGNKQYITNIKNTLNNSIKSVNLQIVDTTNAIETIRKIFNSKIGNRLIDLLQNKKYKEAIIVCDEMIKIIESKEAELKKYKIENDKKKAIDEAKKAEEELLAQLDKEDEKKGKKKKKKKKDISTTEASDIIELKAPTGIDIPEFESSTTVDSTMTSEAPTGIDIPTSETLNAIDSTMTNEAPISSDSTTNSTVKKKRIRKKKAKEESIEKQVNEIVTDLITNVIEKTASLDINKPETINFITDVIEEVKDKINEGIDNSETVKDVEKVIKEGVKEGVKKINESTLIIHLTDSDFEDEEIINQEILDPVLDEKLIDMYLETAFAIDNFDESVKENYYKKIQYMNTRLKENMTLFNNNKKIFDSLNSFNSFITTQLERIKITFENLLKVDLSYVKKQNIEYALNNKQTNLTILYSLYDYLLEWKVYLLTKYLDMYRSINDIISYNNVLIDYNIYFSALTNFRNIRL